MQNACAEIKLRAERRAGEMLAEIPRSNGGRPEKNSFDDGTSFERIIKEENIPKTTAYSFQSIAALPEEVFEQAIAETKNNCDELTLSRMLKISRRYTAKNDKADPPPLTASQRSGIPEAPVNRV